MLLALGEPGMAELTTNPSQTCGREYNGLSWICSSSGSHCFICIVYTGSQTKTGRLAQLVRDIRFYILRGFESRLLYMHLSRSLTLAAASLASAGLRSVLDGVKTPDGWSLGALLNGTAAGVASIEAVQRVVQNAVGSLGPSQAQSQQQQQQQLRPFSMDDLLAYAAHMVDGGILSLDGIALIEGLADSPINQLGATADSNPEPSPPIYPSLPGDAPYSVPEASLRDSIYIPETFQFGANDSLPVLLVPGTGAPAGTTYHYSFGHLAKAVPNADVVWLNAPNLTLEDAQVTAEYVAYAINYLSAVTHNTSLAVISWSQGGPDVQWALKYWPSTRAHVSDFIPLSPNFHGTLLGNSFCPLLSPILCDPSVAQQAWGSNFAKALAADDGDSAYVPTTGVYTLTDRFVQPSPPESGTNASAMLNDVRGVGVSNTVVQEVCPGQPAAAIVTHEGILYSSLAWALAADALTHDGPGDVTRIDRDVVCAHFAAPQLQLDDVLGCEATFIIGLVHFIAHPHKVFREPALKSYAISTG